MGAVSLKTQNLLPLSVLALLQLLTAYFVTQGTFDASQLKSLASIAGLTLAASAVVTWFSYLMPANIKNMLIFLRFKNALPGHRFIQLSRDDSRIDFEILSHRVPDIEKISTSHHLQNQYWYREIYRPLVNEVEVASTHKAYLLYRDAMAVSLICLIGLGLSQFILPATLSLINLKGTAFLSMFFIGFGVAANTAGKRLVTTSVAIFISK